MTRRSDRQQTKQAAEWCRQAAGGSGVGGRGSGGADKQPLEPIARRRPFYLLQELIYARGALWRLPPAEGRRHVVVRQPSA